MEQQLAEYRAERQSRAATDGAEKPLLGKTARSDVDQAANGESAARSQSIGGEADRPRTSGPRAEPSRTDRYLQRTSLVVKCLLWLILLVIFVKLEFGAVFFVLSCLYLIWTNLRSGPKKPGELSAYSVFNPNFEAIEGTLTAEQFEREIKFGSAAVK